MKLNEDILPPIHEQLSEIYMREDYRCTVSSVQVNYHTLTCEDQVVHCIYDSLKV